MSKYEGDRIEGRKEAIANHVTQAISKLLTVGVSQMDHPGEKACLLGGSAIPSLSGLAVLFGDHRNKGDVINPTIDEIIFGACYVIAAVEMHPQGLLAGFSFPTVIEAERLFKMVTGREYPLHPFVAQATEVVKGRATDVPDHLKKFVS